MTDAVQMQAPQAAVEDAPSPPGTKDPAGSDPGDRPKSTPDAGVDAGSSPKDSGPDSPKDAGPTPDSGHPSKDAGSALPPGAQIAVRVDMQRIRASPIAEDVRGLLAAIPDWKALLDGSGIDPVDDIDRLLLATPNLQRSRVVIAGRYRETR
jgi:hypothetical protein